MAFLRTQRSSLYLRLVGALALVLLIAPRAAWADTKATDGGMNVVASESWAGQLEGLTHWIDQHRRTPPCSDRCYILDRILLSGKLDHGSLHFEVTGSVLADGPVAVPLFGVPGHLRVEDATEDGKEAVIGFEGDHYYLYTAARHFTLRGSLVLSGDLAMVLPGPLNTFEGKIDGGQVLEGSVLTGLTNATIHFGRGGSTETTGPTVFQLSRAVRVGREIGFEYRLVLRSGSDLGVVRLPLRFGERVLDVAGAAGFRVEGEELILPTSGRSASITITGTLGKVGAFSPDSRSPYEWWLLESDAEHRIAVGGDSRQLDAKESPIARSQANARLFLVQKGQHIDVTVQSLASVEVLAAVVRHHARSLVLTRQGDVVSDDSLSYENNGIDYLLYAASGRTIYLATDDKSERIMQQTKGGSEILVPLRTGSHTIHLQSLAAAALGQVAGRLVLPTPSYPLTASRVNVSVGVPAGVVPIALFGGDKPTWFFGERDLFAALIGLVLGALAVRVDVGTSAATSRRRRAVGALALGGLWFLAPPVYVLLVVSLVGMWILTILARLLRGVRFGLLAVPVVGILGIIGLVGVVATLSSPRSESGEYSRPAKVTMDNMGDVSSADDRGGARAQQAVGGVVEGVTPVALTLPSAAHTIYATRELVTRERPFVPVLYYVTGLVVGPMGIVWLLIVGVLIWDHAAFARRTWDTVKERIEKVPDAKPTD